MDFRFSVKELSKIVGLSSRNIRYYDQIGLFKSSGVLDNGYRYYTIDKIEEINIINYLRHTGFSIKEIKQHLENRNIDEYDMILKKQLKKTADDIRELQSIQYKINKRISSLNYIRNLPPLDCISIQSIASRKIIHHEMKIESQIDWEITLNKMDQHHNFLPNIFIGDIGFFVDLKKVHTRGPEEFSGIFLLADDPAYKDSDETKELVAGPWLTLYIKGDHKEAKDVYKGMLDYARENKLTLGEYALERVLIDHYISSDPNYHITEILIPIIE